MLRRRARGPEHGRRGSRGRDGGALSPLADERRSLAPRPASLPPPRRPEDLRAHARAVATAAPPPADPTALLVATIFVVGVVDFLIPLRAWAALPLTLATTALLLPWAIVIVRNTRHALVERGLVVRTLLLHAANFALGVAFLAAKWLVVVDALSGGQPGAYVASYRSYTVALLLLMTVGGVIGGGRVTRLVAASADQPARLMAGSFGLVALVGGLLLTLPVCLQRPWEASFVDSLFISVSAVCVTGLSTVNVAETYTIVGQAVICGLIQVGGLGIMVITAAVTMLAGRRLGVKGSLALAEMVDSRSLSDVRRTVGMIVTYTLVFEAIGAFVFYTQFRDIPTIRDGTHDVPGLVGAGHPAWAAVFHAVSAFCNAGFSTFHDNVVPFVGSPIVVLTLVSLIVTGGIGFPVVHELSFRWTHRLMRRRPPRWTLNTRVALATTASLLLGMTAAYLVLERTASFEGLGVVEQLCAALLQSASARTAGFNMVDLGKFRPSTQLLTCFAMFIGGGSGSIAGGIKVTTFAVLFATLRAELRGKSPELFDRRIPDLVVRRAMGVGLLAALLVAFIVLVLLVVEDHPPLAILFETVSAFSTTGLTVGITPQLTVAGKLIVALTMLIGRVGPITAALALSGRVRGGNRVLPEERVMIG